MWLVLPMSYLSAPALEDSNSVSDSPFQRLGRSATLKGKHLPPASWRRACKTISWMKRLSGATLPASTASHGAALWISSLRDTPARRSPPWENEEDEKTQDTSGPTLPGSSTRPSPSSSSPRTYPTTSGSGFETSSLTSKISDTKVLLDCLRRLKWACPKSGKGSSFWPTPRASMPAIGNSNRFGEHRLEDVLAGWVVRNKDRLGLPGDLRVRRLPRPSRTGDGSSPIICRINLLFLERMMNQPPCWTNPSASISPTEFDAWETAWSRRVLATLSAYFSEGFKAVFQDPSEETWEIKSIFQFLEDDGPSP